MSAFKQFLSTDVIVAPLVVNKSFSFEGNVSLENNGIIRLLGLNYNKSSSAFFTSASQGYNSSSISIGGLFNSVKQLYYTNYIPNPISGSPYITDYLGSVVEDDSLTNVYSRFYNYESTTLFQTNSFGYTSNYGYSRYFNPSANGDIHTLTISRNIFGDYINPNTLHVKFPDNPGSSTYYELYDNGEGILMSSPNLYYNETAPVGIVNYSHGTIIITDRSYIPATDSVWFDNNFTCSFQSSRTIYETQYKCTIRPEEFNFSLNPSLISGSSEGTVYNFVTGSYFSPYVTTVGFYNEAQELLMVAKLGQPLPTSRTTDTTILVNVDK
jgi:hypothetical protein